MLSIRFIYSIFVGETTFLSARVCVFAVYDAYIHIFPCACVCHSVCACVYIRWCECFQQVQFTTTYILVPLHDVDFRPNLFSNLHIACKQIHLGENYKEALLLHVGVYL